MIFRVLGPLQVEGPSGPIRIPPGRQRIVLAALLLEVNRQVSTDYLVDAIWEHDPPETARTQVQICVSRLRRLLAPTGAAIETRTPNYLLRVNPLTVDAQVYSQRVDEARDLSNHGRISEAAALLRSAAGLWNGPALDGVPSRILRAKAARLDEDRLTTIETYLDLELQLGRHSQLIGEITELVEQHPLRERLRSQLMLALYRSGRQAEALEVYRTGRELLIKELGLEPGDELRSLEAAILAGDPALRPADPPAPAAPPEPPPSSPTRGVTPYQLPTDTADFVGRTEALETIRTTLLNSDGAVGVAVLLGRPGVGKSATAVHAAHQLAADHYPDGQLYCDLRASRGAPLPPSDILGRFLRALGVPGQAIPDDPDERAAMYRGLLATRRVLVVLDDAVSESQVLPLIPGGRGCGVIITSRSRLTGIPGATLVELDILSGDQSLELLSRVVGAKRINAEPEAARALVRSVGRLPLALRIVAARLAARPHWTLASMVGRLADERHNLDELEHGDMTVRASLSLTYDGLDPRSARVFRLLGLVDGPTIPCWTAGALLDDARPFPSDLVDPLVDAQMLDVTGVDTAGEPTYRFHDLTRGFSWERLVAEEDDADRRAASERLAGGWLALVDEANRRMMGGTFLQLRGDALRWHLPRHYRDRLLSDPAAWLESERANLGSAVAQAAEAGLDGHCWELVTGFAMFLERRGYFDDFDELHSRAVRAVQAAGNRRGAAALAYSSVTRLLHQRRHKEARTVLNRTLAEFIDLGDGLGQALCQRHLAYLASLSGDDQTARELCEKALAGFSAADDLGGRWRTLMLLGHLRIRAGETEAGLADLDAARHYAELTGDPRARAQVLRRLAQAALHRGERDAALDQLQTALELVSGLDDPIGEALLLYELGLLHLAEGKRDAARGLLERALRIREQLNDSAGIREIASVLDTLRDQAPVPDRAAR